MLKKWTGLEHSYWLEMDAANSYHKLDKEYLIGFYKELASIDNKLTATKTDYHTATQFHKHAQCILIWFIMYTRFKEVIFHTVTKASQNKLTYATMAFIPYLILTLHGGCQMKNNCQWHINYP